MNPFIFASLCVLCMITQYHVHGIQISETLSTNNYKKKTTSMTFLRGQQYYNSHNNEKNEQLSRIILSRSPPLPVAPMESQQEPFRFSQRNLMFKNMSNNKTVESSSEGDDEDETPSTSSTGAGPSGATGAETGSATGSATGESTGSATGESTGSASGAANTNSKSNSSSAPSTSTNSKNASKTTTNGSGEEDNNKKTQPTVDDSAGKKDNKTKSKKDSSKNQKKNKTSTVSAATTEDDDDDEVKSTNAVTAASGSATGAETSSSTGGEKEEMEKKKEKEIVSKNTSKVLKDLNKDLPQEDQFLTKSKDAEDALNDIAVDDTNSTSETVVVGPASSTTSSKQPPLKVSSNNDGKKATFDSTEYEPQNIPELGGSVMVHKESKLPITYSPIVMPTVQEVGTLKEIKEVRTPVGHVPANYNGTLFKKLDIHPTTIHIHDPADPNQLNVPKNLPTNEDKKNPFAIGNDINEWKTDAKRLLKWASVEEKHLHLNDQSPKNVYENVQNDNELHLFGRGSPQQ